MTHETQEVVWSRQPHFHCCICLMRGDRDKSIRIKEFGGVRARCCGSCYLDRLVSHGVARLTVDGTVEGKASDGQWVSLGGEREGAVRYLIARPDPRQW